MTPSALTATDVLRTLKKLYNPPRCFLDWGTPFHLLFASILSAQCTDKRVNIVTKTLFLKYKKPEDVIATPLEELEADIRSCGHYHMKAKYLKLSSALLIERFGGEVPDSMEELLELPGVGRKIASVILYAAFEKNEGLAVDTHVFRVARRLGLSASKTQDKVELDLTQATPRKDWGALHTRLISHGRAVCTARNRRCEVCVFAAACPSSRVLGRKDLAAKD